MQRLFLSLLICLGFALPATAHAWWQDDWHYRKQISVDTTAQGAAINQALGRTALLVRLHTGNFTFDGVKDDGSDVRFVSADDKTVFNHQIESFDPLMGMALIWVDVPKVEGGQRQDLWMYYGNQKAPATANGQLTFDPTYTALYHFDGVSGTPPRDTTAYANTALNATGSSIDGVVGRALQFSGQPLLLPASPSLQHTAGSAFTFSAWLRLDQASGEQIVLARREGLHSLLLGLNQGTPFVEIDGQRAVSTQPLNPGQWQHLAFTAEGEKSCCMSMAAKPRAWRWPCRRSTHNWRSVPICRKGPARTCRLPGRWMSCACPRWPARRPCCWPMRMPRAPSRNWWLMAWMKNSRATVSAAWAFCLTRCR